MSKWPGVASSDVAKLPFTNGDWEALCGFTCLACLQTPSYTCKRSWRGRKGWRVIAEAILHYTCQSSWNGRTWDCKAHPSPMHTWRYISLNVCLLGYAREFGEEMLNICTICLTHATEFGKEDLESASRTHPTPTHARDLGKAEVESACRIHTWRSYICMQELGREVGRIILHMPETWERDNWRVCIFQQADTRYLGKTRLGSAYACAGDLGEAEEQNMSESILHMQEVLESCCG